MSLNIFHHRSHLFQQALAPQRQRCHSLWCLAHSKLLLSSKPLHLLLPLPGASFPRSSQTESLLSEPFPSEPSHPHCASLGFTYMTIPSLHGEFPQICVGLLTACLHTLTWVLVRGEVSPLFFQHPEQWPAHSGLSGIIRKMNEMFLDHFVDWISKS